MASNNKKYIPNWENKSKFHFIIKIKEKTVTNSMDFLDNRKEKAVNRGMNTTALYSNALKAKNLLTNENILTKIKRKYICILTAKQLVSQYI